jgi:2-polyprenyl-3-methyl-5-hydroxy-6-metoxy-1,4-benzoquinol methylase
MEIGDPISPVSIINVFCGLFSTMSDQVEYYNHFGKLNKTAILTCPEPELWTTDYNEKGRIYNEMLERTRHQTSLIDEFFSNQHSVLDAGCGFGRQAFILAKKGFSVVGVDNSQIFIELATELFERHHLHARFFHGDLMEVSLGQFSQLILFDVLEHISPAARRTFLKKLNALSVPDATLIVSVPHLKKRFTSQLNNKLRKKITQHFSYFLAREEHPYPVPTRADITRLTSELYTIVKFEQSPVTDFYVLRKL